MNHYPPLFKYLITAILCPLIPVKDGTLIDCKEALVLEVLMNIY